MQLGVMGEGQSCVVGNFRCDRSGRSLNCVRSLNLWLFLVPGIIFLFRQSLSHSFFHLSSFRQPSICLFASLTSLPTSLIFNDFSFDMQDNAMDIDDVPLTAAQKGAATKARNRAQQEAADQQLLQETSEVLSCLNELVFSHSHPRDGHIRQAKQKANETASAYSQFCSRFSPLTCILFSLEKKSPQEGIVYCRNPRATRQSPESWRRSQYQGSSETH